MTKYEFDRPVRGLELMRELEAAGFSPTLPDHTPRLSWRDDLGKCWVEGEEAEGDAIAAVVNAHDAASFDTADTARLTEYRQDKLRLREFLNAPNTSITLLALVVVVKRLLRVLIYKWRELERDDE